VCLLCQPQHEQPTYINSGNDKSHAHLVGRFDVFQKGEEGGNVDLSLKVLQGGGAPILKLISLLPIRRLLALLVLLFGLLLGIVAVIVVVVHVGIVAAAFAGAVVDLMLLWLLWVRGSYHRFPKSFRSHDVHSTEKGKISLNTEKYQDKETVRYATAHQY
jgi:hypothetical protein